MELHQSQIHNTAPQVIRVVTVNDLPWQLELARNNFNDIDESHTANFLTEIMQLPNCIVLRGNHACMAAHVYEWPYNQSVRFAEELFMASDGKNGWEIYLLLKEIIAWVRTRGNVRWFDFHLGEASNTGRSLEPFARRLGARSLGNNTYRVTIETAH
jgi:hypothetical protein